MERYQQPMEIVYRTSQRTDCARHAVVLEAAGIAHGTHHVAGEFVLVVAAGDASHAREELAAYAKENRAAPASTGESVPTMNGWIGVLVYVAVLVLVTALVQRQTFGLDWFAAGKAQAELILRGCWWRTITALTLHADLPHLFANLVFGSLIGFFAGQILGSGLAWASILVAGAAGNLLNAYVRGPSHNSVGASTAVFAALGLVAACAWQQRRNLRRSALARWSPLIGGAVLLSYLGTGGVRTDVTAHGTGFIAGVLLGTLYGRLGRHVLFAAATQWLLGLGAIALIALAWIIALGPSVRP